MNTNKANLTSRPTKDLPPARANTEALRARCYDKDWQYTPAGSTDLRAKFEAIKQQQAEAAKQPANVKPIRAKGV